MVTRESISRARLPTMRLLIVQILILFAAVCFLQSVLITAFQARSYLFDSRQDLFRRRDLVRTNAQSRRSADANDASAFRFHTQKRNQQQRDVVIVGGALAGLSAALYLSQMDPSRHVTILDRETYGNHRFSSSSNSNNAQPASFAAAGMLAPQSERLPPGHLLDLCMASRRLFPDFCDMVETLARESGDEGAPFLYDSEFPDRKNGKDDDDNDGNLDPWSVGYVGSGGFLAPAFAGDSVATWAPPDEVGSAVWLDATQARELEPLLHPDVVGGWWFPEDASVDARRLTCSLRAACIAAGVQFLSGPQYEVASLDLVDGTCRGLWLKNSKSKQGQRYIRAKTVLVANGAWMRSLLPVPIEPHKGQSLSLRMPKDRPPILRRVLFAQDSYIVPKADGRIVVGATVEAGSYDPDVTPAGLMHIMAHAVQLVPALKDLPVEETWAGLRPTTPDKGPILGKTPWDNLFVAGGYWRNGVLLAPKTGQLLASLILSSSSSAGERQFATLEAQDKDFLDAFAWDRFTSADKGAALAANARYAASMHPIHKRSSSGVSAAVGTELGSYSSARAAVDDRKRDRDALNDEDEAAFERAAAMGKQDGSAYSFGEEGISVTSKSGRADWPSLLQNDDITATSTTTSSAERTEETTEPARTSSATNDLAATYEAIRKNKERNAAQLEESSKSEQDDDRPDPGFRIYHVDAETGEERMVPPFTQPGDFLKMIETEKKGTQPVVNGESASSEKEPPVVTVEAPTAVEITATRPEVVGSSSDDGGDGNYNETTYDGYTCIQQSNSRASRQEELEAMREARRRNRLGQETVDEKQIGVQRMNGDSMASFQEDCE